MDIYMAKMDPRTHNFGSSPSEESALDMERNYCNNHNLPESSPPPLQAFASGGQLSESNAAYFSWPACRITDGAEDRANYFGNLQKGVLPETLGRRPTGLQATTLLELMTIRAFHSKFLRRFSLGTAIGFRIRRGMLYQLYLSLLLEKFTVGGSALHSVYLLLLRFYSIGAYGPGGVWCDVDVVEFSYYGAPAATPKEQLYTELVDGFGGSDPCIGSGSQVASQETYGTLGAIVKSRTGNRQVGFLTNRHVAVDLDYPSQKMFHPLPPSLGPGVYLGAVERATSFITDDLWYGIFAGTNPETFVRADGAFIPFAEDFNMANVTTLVKGVGEIGDVNAIDLQSRIGDSGSLILLTSQNGEKPRPVGIIWGGTANRGRLKLKVGQPPENWTSGVDLGRLLDLLELDLITSPEGLHEVMLTGTAGCTSNDRKRSINEYEISHQLSSRVLCYVRALRGWSIATNLGKQVPESRLDEFHIEGVSEVVPSVEHQFIPSYSCKSLLNDSQQGEKTGLENLSLLRGESEGELCVSLELGEPKPKRRKQSDALS
ncbi:protein NARROW LEAF 1 [Sesamum angolense]|uniref:Protein NARROW LEAF 1 n=1 Tax=Sesamum angolense TaxID=2727404 RepID=A0AAE1WUH7_9LAMI|nr:protein NARROW LEAF 1 [Sesamum angolense]